MKETLRALLEETITSLCDLRQLGNLRKVEQMVTLTSSRRAAHGDYSTGICLKLAGVSGLSALEIGEIILEKICSETRSLADVQLAKPGFLNFTLSQNALMQIFQHALKAASSDSFAANLQHPAGLLPLCSNHDHRDEEFFSKYTLLYCLRLLQRSRLPVFELEQPTVQIQLLDELTWTMLLQRLQNDEKVFAAAFLEPMSSILARRIAILLDEASALLCLSSYATLAADCRHKAHAMALAAHDFVGLAPLFIEDEALLSARLGIIYATAIVLQKLLENSTR